MHAFRTAGSLLVTVALIASCSDQPAGLAIDGVQFATRNQVVHRASLGGADACEALGAPTGCDANFSLVALEYADGSVSGQWQDSFGHGNGGIHVAVDCIAVVGNGAVVGGVITQASGFAAGSEGQRAVTAVRDNGTAAGDPADQLSFSFFPAGTCAGLTPAGFPLFNLAHGQVVVR